MRWLVLFLSVFSSISLRAPVAIAAASIARTIVVDLKGGGDFESIQQAIDSVGSPSPTLCLERVGRSCGGGVSREKVNVKSTKSYIVLEGDGAQTTSIEWGDYSDSSGRTTDASATFTSYASNFVAKRITFKVSLISSLGFKTLSVICLEDTTSRIATSKVWLTSSSDMANPFMRYQFDPTLVRRDDNLRS
ncbi:hypothetical protein B296_00053252 [Ensete ventricosum]|uniref:pectinesterase n=1 Tax=Ensete ventricosum TaxID=4639 RepID=A0A426XH45_ENSVE|nr:hypothetical protein B296_00053252 [Ensete ventricosum]